MEHGYLKYRLDSVLGLNATRARSICTMKSKQAVLVAQASDLTAYSPTLSAVIKVFKKPEVFDKQEETIQITDFAVSPNEEFIAIGYSNAEVVVFNYEGEMLANFVGHRRAITCVAFNDDSSLVASGAQDNDIVIWDVAGGNGVCRLTGHQNIITDLVFIPGTPWLVSSSKDTHIRVWDLDIQSCIQTVTVAAAELYALKFVGQSKIIAAGKSPVFFIFKIARPEEVDPKTPNVLTSDSTIERQDEHRVQQIAINDDGKQIAIVTSGNAVEIYNTLSPEEIEKKWKRRLKRAQKNGGTPTEVSMFEYHRKIISPVKVVNAAYLDNLLFLTTADNSVQVYKYIKPSEDEDPTFVQAHSTPGHTSDIRGLAFFGQAESESVGRILSCSNGEVRVWDMETKQCVSKIETGYATSIAALPGGRFAIVGTREGAIWMVDVATAQAYGEHKNAHAGRIWSIAIATGCTQIATASSDKEVHFWALTIRDNMPDIVHKKTLKLPDEVYAVTFNPDGTQVACALLDSTVRIFHTDTLNFNISLYGSQLPVTFVDYSSDGELIITASADKNLRIWGAEFGDCHRSLWAHDSVVSCAKFIPNTHMCLTAGRDGVVKIWDCDRFKCVQRLWSHIGEIFAMDISPDGEYAVTGGRDKGLRLWQRTNEHFYLSVEEEQSLEQRMESENAERRDRTVAALRNSVFGGAVVDTAARANVESINHGDRLRDDIDRADEEQANPGSNPVMRMRNQRPQDYLVDSMRRINRAQMDLVMQSLPFTSAVSFIRWAELWLAEGREVELTVRCLTALIKFHGTQLERADEARDALARVRTMVHEQVNEMRSRCGSNLAALKLISREMTRPF